MKIIPRAWLAVCATVLVAAPFAALSQAWPAKPIRVVTEFIAGAGGDISVRIIMAQLSSLVGQPVVIENHAGGSGVIAAQLVIRASADGYTLLAITPNAPVVRVHLAKSNQIDAQHTLTPVTALFETALVLVAHPSRPGKFAAGADRLREAEPRQAFLRNERAGLLAPSRGRAAANADRRAAVHVPYKAMQQAMLDVAERGRSRWPLRSPARSRPW